MPSCSNHAFFKFGSWMLFMSAMKHTTKILNTSSQLESYLYPCHRKTFSWLLIHSSNKLAAIRKVSNESTHNLNKSLIMYNIIEINFLQWVSDVAPALLRLPSVSNVISLSLHRDHQHIMNTTC